VRWLTRIATKVRTDVPLVLDPHFICIAAALVKLNAAGIRRGDTGQSSNGRLKSNWRAKLDFFTIWQGHAAAAISRRAGQKFSPRCC
jgi:hypothetical protein